MYLLCCSQSAGMWSSSHLEWSKSFEKKLKISFPRGKGKQDWLKLPQKIQFCIIFQQWGRCSDPAEEFSEWILEHPAILGTGSPCQALSWFQALSSSGFIECPEFPFSFSVPRKAFKPQLAGHPEPGTVQEINLMDPRVHDEGKGFLALRKFKISHPTKSEREKKSVFQRIPFLVQKSSFCCLPIDSIDWLLRLEDKKQNLCLVSSDISVQFLKCLRSKMGIQQSWEHNPITTKPSWKKLLTQTSQKSENSEYVMH